MARRPDDPHLPPLHRRRWWLFGGIFAGALAIWAIAPNYTDVQLADDANDFRELVGEYGEFRVAVGAIIDFVFAVVYAAAAVAFFGHRRHSAVGVGLVVAGAVFDELENSFVLGNVLDIDRLTDGSVDWMAWFGTLKMTALILGVIVLVISGLLARFGLMTARDDGNQAV